MSAKKLAAALLLALGMFAAPAWAQSGNQQQQRSPSISDRLRSFRDSVFGPGQSSQGQYPNQGQGNNSNMRSNQGSNGYNGNGSQNSSNQPGRMNGQMQNGQMQNGQMQNGRTQNGQRQNGQMQNGQQNGQRQNGQPQNNRASSGNSRTQSGSSSMANSSGRSSPPSLPERPMPNRKPESADAAPRQASKPQRPSSSRRTAQPQRPPEAPETDATDEPVEDPASDEANDDQPRRLTPADLQEQPAENVDSSETIDDPEQLIYEPPSKKSSRRRQQKQTEEAPVTMDEQPAESDSATPKMAATLPRVMSSAKPPKASEELSPRVEPARSESPRSSHSSRSGNDFLVTKRGPSIKVETTGPRRVMVNRPGVYKVNLHNAGDVPAEDVLVVVQVPAWAEVLSAEATAGESREPSGDRQEGEFQWAVANLDAHNHEELVLQIVAHENRSFDLGVQWSNSPVVAQTKVEVQEAKLEVELSGPREVSFGEKAVYKLSLSNPGSADAENVVVKLLPLGNGGEPIETHALGRLSAGAIKTVEVELVARQEGDVKVQVEAAAEGGLTASATENVVVRRPTIKVAIDAPKFRYSGAVATYNVVVTNTGNDSARDVQVNVQLPRGAQFASCSSGGQRVNNGAGVTWRADSVRAGEEREFQVKCGLTAPGANRAQATATAAGDLSHNASITTQVEALADLTLEVTDPQGAIAVGEDVTYEIVIRNRGSKAADAVEVTAAFSQSVLPMSVSGGKHSIRGSKVEFEPISAISPGQEVTLKIKAQARRAGTHVLRTEVRSQAMQAALVEEETTRFYGDTDDDGAESSRAEPARSSDTQAVEFRPRGSTIRTQSSDRQAQPASHEADDWVSSHSDVDSGEEPRRLDEPAELQPLERN